MFVNFSNHTHEKWSMEQLHAAQQYGSVVTVPFPQVPTCLTDEEFESLVSNSVEAICRYNPTVVMAAGESTVLCAVVFRLMSHDIKVVAACSDRVVVENVNSDGTTTKTATFQFKGFREYRM